MADRKEMPSGTEYVVDRIVGHDNTDKGMRYRVRWYGYQAKDDTMEPEANVPKHFIHRYSKRQRHSRTRSRTTPP